MRDYTTSLTQIKVKEHERHKTSFTEIKVKEHERLYNITHTYQSKGTRETMQHHSHKSK